MQCRSDASVCRGGSIQGCSKSDVLHVENGICHLKPGEYAATYELTESLKKVYSIDIPIRELQNNPETAEVLGKFVPANAIPNQYLGYSVREMSEKFGGRLPKESMEMLDAELREL